MIDIKQLRALADRWQSEADAARQQFGEAGASEAIAKATAGPELIALLDSLPSPTSREFTGAWQTIEPVGDPLVRRLKVPGGWLLQVEHHAVMEPVASVPGHHIYGWHPPVFVPEPKP